jgi:transposase
MKPNKIKSKILSKNGNRIKELDFSDTTFYIGIDVHKKSWSVTIISEGKTLVTLSMDPSPEGLVKYLHSRYPNGKYYSVYEAGFCGFWIDQNLKALGVNNIIVSPADIPSKSKERRRKTDVVDSKKLARELSVGNLEGIYIPTEENISLRSFVRLRMQLTNDQTRIKNRIKSLLNFKGIEIPPNTENKHWSKNFINYLYNLSTKDDYMKYTLITLLDILLRIREQLLSIVKKLRTIVKANPEINNTIMYLQSVPGVGFIIAVTFYTEIMDIARFPRLDEIATYVGLAPAIYSSGQKEKTLGLSKQKNKYLRNLLIQAAWVAIRKDPAMLKAYGVLRRKMSEQKAIIRITKKLLSRMRFVWSNETKYQLSVA